MPAVILGDATKSERLSVTDCLEVLRNEAGFNDSDFAELKTLSMRADCGFDYTLNGLHFVQQSGNEYVVFLPPANQFEARSPNSEKKGLLDTCELDGATVHANGNITLKNGQTVWAVEICRSTKVKIPTVLEEQITCFALSKLPYFNQRFCRSRWSTLPPHIQRTLPEDHWLDWGLVIDHSLHGLLKFPPLKTIRYDFNKEYSLHVSLETIRQALVRSGIWQPKRRTSRRELLS